MAERYLPVLLEYRQAVNPEPGVARAPSLAEQRRAIGRMVTTWGGELGDDAVIARGGSEPLVVDVADGTRGVVMFSLQALQRGPAIDIAVAQSIWSRVDALSFLVEDLHARDEQSFAELLDMIVAINAVVQRDGSAEWRNLVLSRAPGGPREPSPQPKERP
jgi:hypothetical protein